MKIHKIASALSLIDDEFITEADKQPQTSKNRKPMFLAVGGSVAAALLGVFLLRIGAISGTPGGKCDTRPGVLSEPASSAYSEAGASGAPDASVSEPEAPDTSIPAPATEKIPINYDALPFEYEAGERAKLTDLSIFSGGGGAAAFGEDSPWNENMNIGELPVFRSVERGFIRPSDYIPILERFADILGYELTDISYETMDKPEIFGPDAAELYKDRTDRLTARAGDVTFEVNAHSAAGKMNITASGLPNADEALLTKLMSFGYPVKSGEGYIYNSSEDIFTEFLNFNFRRAKLFTYPTGEKTAAFSELYSTLDCMGMYPTITAAEAKARLLAGEYRDIPSNRALPDGLKESNITKPVQLEYQFNRACEYYTPFYEFYIEADGNCFTAYVPAIAPEYLALSNDVQQN